LSQKSLGQKSSRRYVLAAGLASAGTIAAPQISRAQTRTLRFQSAWRSKDILHEFALGYAKSVSDMTGGRIRIDMAPAGGLVPPIQMQEAVHAGVLDGSHGSCSHWYNKHRAFALFGSPPPFGWDSQGMLAWFYQGGGEALYGELTREIMKLNIVGMLAFPMPAQPLGFFKKEIRTPDDLKGVRYRTVGLAAELARDLGAVAVTLPSGDVATAMDKGLLDAAEYNNPMSDLMLNVWDMTKFYMVGSYHRPIETFEIAINKTRFDAFPPEVKAILRAAAFASSAENVSVAYDRYSKDMEEIRQRGVTVARTGQAVLDAQLAAWTVAITELSKESFFAKVVASQKAWVKRTLPYLQTNNMSSAELLAAYRHFFAS
jgi:TRAP-type mannitol/chloroaromatic compound transport system substrate-binding protein